MHVLLDHLAAVVVGSVVLLLLLAAGQRRQEEARQVSTHYVEQRQATQFVETLERDVQSALEVEAIASDRLALVVSSDALTGARQQVEYRTTPHADGEHLEVRRLVDGMPVGGVHLVRSWAAQGLAGDGTTTSTLADVRSIALFLSFPRR